MAMNMIQFQKGLSMNDFFERFGSEYQCREYLEKARWSKGFVCPKCESENHCVVWHGEQKTFQCKDCRTQTTLTSGTIFQNTKLSILKWFQAMFFLTQSKNNVSALELTRLLGVCYRTAWRLKHKLIQAMTERESSRKLEGEVQLDDSYLGGEKPGGKAGRGSENKVPFLAAVETNAKGHPTHAIFQKIDAFRKVNVKTWAQDHLVNGTLVTSDGLHCFNVISETENHHNKVVVGSGQKSTELSCFKWVNTVLSNLKTAISGTYHSFKFKKYADRYLAEVQYRFNRRFDMSVMLDRLAYALVQTSPRPEKWLRGAEA